MTRFILVRGLAREAGHWHDFDLGLRARFEGCRVERHDLLGNGALWRARSPLSTAEQAADLRARVWSVSREPVVLVAISLGAMVCLDWIRRWPADGIAGLAAINTSVGGLCRPWERMRPAAMLTTWRTLRERDAVARERAVLELTTSGFGDDLELAQAHAELHARQPIGRLNTLRQVIAAASFRAARMPSRVPILLLNAAEDRMVDPACSRKIAAAYGAQLRVHPCAGHDLTLDDPQWCAQQILQWREALCVE